MVLVSEREGKEEQQTRSNGNQRTHTVSHPWTRHFITFVPSLISDSVIGMSQLHMFKLSTFAFLNRRPRVLTVESGKTRGNAALGLALGDSEDVYDRI
jgi:hypothetical protein